MGGLYFSMGNFSHMILHHASILDRYDPERKEKFSVIVFSVKNKDMLQITQLVRDVLRDSDAVFRDGEHIFILLPKTDMPGVLRVRFQIEDYLQEKLECMKLTYPGEAESGEQMLGRILEYVSEARGENSSFPEPELSD